MPAALPEGVRKLFQAPNYAHLATLMPDGSPTSRSSGSTWMATASWLTLPRAA